MSTYPTPRESDLLELLSAATDQSLQRKMLDYLDQKDPEKRIGLSAIYNYAMGKMDDNTAAIKRSLLGNRNLRSIYHKFLKESGYNLGIARAASDSGALPRKEKGCSIRVSESQAMENMSYVIIELEKHLDDNVSKLSVFDAEENLEEFQLPKPRDGIIQMGVEKGSKLMSLLADPNTEFIIT